MTDLHLLRCETCDFCEKEEMVKEHFKYCNRYDQWISNTEQLLLEVIGCASHSHVQADTTSITNQQNETVHALIDSFEKLVKCRSWEAMDIFINELRNPRPASVDTNNSIAGLVESNGEVKSEQ